MKTREKNCKTLFYFVVFCPTLSDTCHVLWGQKSDATRISRFYTSEKSFLWIDGFKECECECECGIGQKSNKREYHVQYRSTSTMLNVHMYLICAVSFHLTFNFQYNDFFLKLQHGYFTCLCICMRTIQYEKIATKFW